MSFKNIHGYDDIKAIVKQALEAEESYNLAINEGSVYTTKNMTGAPGHMKERKSR